MPIEVVIPKSPDICYRAFCDAGSSRMWVPGLKTVRVVRTDELGRPMEVSYQFGGSLSYALVYAYEAQARQVRWVPSAGIQDGVSGRAYFEPHPQGCLFTYSLESRRGRTPDHADQVARAFARWVSAGRMP